MKKTLTIITLLAGAVSGYSQGEIAFNVYQAADRQAVYNTQLLSSTPVSYGGYTVLETMGSSTVAQTTAESPAGTTVYAVGSALSGTGYSAELLVGPAGSSLSAMIPFGGATNGGATDGVVVGFFTGNARHLGFVNSTATFSLPTQGSTYAAGATVSVALAAWNNKGGADATLAAAQKDPTGQWGISDVAQLAGLAASPSPGSTITGIQSFSLGSPIPEPSTIALGVMGASTLLFRRRK